MANLAELYGERVMYTVVQHGEPATLDGRMTTQVSIFVDPELTQLSDIHPPELSVSIKTERRDVARLAEVWRLQQEIAKKVL